LSWTIDDYKNGKVSICQVFTDFVNNKVSKSQTMTPDKINQLTGIISQGMKNPLFADYVNLIQYEFDRDYIKGNPLRTNTNTDCFYDFAGSFLGINAANYINDGLWGAYNHYQYAVEMFNSSDDFDTMMNNPDIAWYWKVLNQAIVGALVWNGITDVGAIAGWLILAGVIGGFKAWLDSLGLPDWIINIINNILGWVQQQTQQQAQQTTQNLQQLVDTIANGNQAIVNLANDFLGWVQSQYPDIVKQISGQTTEVLTGLQQSLTQAVSPTADNINALSQMSAQSRAALATQMGYQLGVNQDLITQQFNLLHKEVMVYPSH
jgi:hypothetical protein